MSGNILEEKYKGWFEGFGNAVSEKLGKNVRDEILDKCETCQKVSSDSEMAVCVKEVIDRFDDIVKDEDKRYSIMETLGNQCVQNILPTTKELKENSEGIEELVKILTKNLVLNFLNLKEIRFIQL